MGGADMLITDIAWASVCVGKTSITVKRPNGKTCGMVRGVSRVCDLPPRIMADIWPTVKRSGVWGTAYSRRLLYVSGVVYYLHNLHGLETLRKCYPGCAAKLDGYAEAAAAAGVVVIPCDIISG